MADDTGARFLNRPLPYLVMLRETLKPELSCNHGELNKKFGIACNKSFTFHSKVFNEPAPLKTPKQKAGPGTASLKTVCLCHGGVTNRTTITGDTGGKDKHHETITM